MTEDEIVKRHHPLNGLNGHESGQTPGDSDPRVRPVCQGTLGVASRVPSTVLYFRMERGTSLDTL